MEDFPPPLLLPTAKAAKVLEAEMAVLEYTGAWTDTTEQAGITGRTRVTAIEVVKNVAQSATVYVQVYDAVAGGGVTPGVTSPHITIPVDSLTRNSNRKVKVIFPGGGILFTTGVCVMNSTTGDGATAPTTTEIVESIKIFHTPGN